MSTKAPWRLGGGNRRYGTVGKMNIGKRGCLLVASRARKTGFEIQWEKIVGEETRGLHTTSHAQPPQGDGRERKISNAPYSVENGLSRS